MTTSLLALAVLAARYFCRTCQCYYELHDPAAVSAHMGCDTTPVL